MGISEWFCYIIILLSLLTVSIYFSYLRAKVEKEINKNSNCDNNAIIKSQQELIDKNIQLENEIDLMRYNDPAIIKLENKIAEIEVENANLRKRICDELIYELEKIKKSEIDLIKYCHIITIIEKIKNRE